MNKTRKNINIITKVGLLIAALVLVSLIFTSKPAKAERDYQYEEYCDSIFFNDKDYYYNVLVETDEYQNYMETHGQWWEEDCPAYLEMKAANDFKRELIDAQDACIKEAEVIMLKHGLYDEYYAKLKFKVDSLYTTQL